MGYIGVITHLLTIDPNFQQDIQVGMYSFAGVSSPQKNRVWPRNLV